MKPAPWLPRTVAALIGLAVVAGAAYLTRDRWWLWLESQFADNGAQHQAAAPETGAPEAAAPAEEAGANELVLSRKARKNLGVALKTVQPQTYWRTVSIPAEIMDRPGVSDRGVTSPAVGVVTRVHRYPGDVVKPGQPLITLRLVSEYLHASQAELFKATSEQELIKEQLARLEGLAKGGAIPEARIIELNNQLRRQNALVVACRQDLLARGLAASQLEQVAVGKFVTSIEVAAPPRSANVAANAGPREGPPTDPVPEPAQAPAAETEEFAYELQDLEVDLGQQVQSGQLLARLSNHQLLYVVGHAFKHEAPFLEAAARERRPVEVEFAEDEAGHWPPLEQTFEIRHLANALDPQSRTFDFFVPLVNQSRRYVKEGATFLAWRFRPGQRARLHVPVEAYANVFLLPATAVVRDGAEAYAFVQSGGRFIRRPLRLLYEDRRHAIVANDGAIKPGARVAQSAAAALNRVLKAQASTDMGSEHEHHHDH